MLPGLFHGASYEIPKCDVDRRERPGCETCRAVVVGQSDQFVADPTNEKWVLPDDGWPQLLFDQRGKK